MFGYRLCGTLPYRQGGVPGPRSRAIVSRGLKKNYVL